MSKDIKAIALNIKHTDTELLDMVEEYFDVRMQLGPLEAVRWMRDKKLTHDEEFILNVMILRDVYKDTIH